MKRTNMIQRKNDGGSHNYRTTNLVYINLFHIVPVGISLIDLPPLFSLFFQTCHSFILGPFLCSTILISLLATTTWTFVSRLFKVCPYETIKIIGPVIAFICRSQKSTLALLQSLLELQFSAQNKKLDYFYQSIRLLSWP